MLSRRRLSFFSLRRLGEKVASRVLRQLEHEENAQPAPSEHPQVLIRPCEDVPILTEEVDELASLFLLQPGTKDDGVIRVSRVDLDLL